MDPELAEPRNETETENHRTKAVNSRPTVIQLLQLLHGKLESETGVVEIPLENASLLFHPKTSRSTQTGPPVHFGASYNRCVSWQTTGKLWADGRLPRKLQMPVIRMTQNARDDADVSSDAAIGSASKDAVMPQFVEVSELSTLKMKRTTKNEDSMHQRTDVLPKENNIRVEPPMEATVFIGRSNSFKSFAIEKYCLNITNYQPPTALPSESSSYYNSNFIRQMAGGNPSSVAKTTFGTLDLDIAELDRQLERIQLECRGIFESDWEQTVPEKRRVVPRMGTRLCVNRLRGRNGFRVSNENDCTRVGGRISHDPQNFHHSSEGENAAGDTSTSAYNTGDSSCSTPLAVLDQLELERRLIESANRRQDSSFNSKTFIRANDEQNPTISTRVCSKIIGNADELKDRDSIASCDHVTATANSVRCGDHATAASNQNRCLRHVSNTAKGDSNAVYVSVMYTNMANLDHTIMVQQRLFDQQLRLKGRGTQESARQLPTPVLFEKSHCTPLVDVKPSHVEEHPGGKLDQTMEWVVKRRSDGTRYIARRPVTRVQPKKQQRKPREHIRNTLSSEEDERGGEVKIGRDQSREERRRHVQAARQRRFGKEKLLRLEETNDQGVIEDCSRVVQLRRSPNRCRNRLETSRPVLQHLSSGHRDALKRLRNPLLSVTTI